MNNNITLVNDQDAADILGVSKGTLQVWRSTGRYNIPYIKIGRNVRYRVSDLMKWLDSRTSTKTTRAKSQDCTFFIEDDQ